MENIIENLKLIHSHIASTSRRGKTPSSIVLVGVTKTVELAKMEKALEAGLNIFAESKVQEFLPKYEYFGERVKWHFIGHLQTNKVKYIIDKVELIQSVDSYKLAIEINKQANKVQKIQEVLLQVNLVDEDSKYGFSINDFREQIDDLMKLSHVKVKGLMFIPPYDEDEEVTRGYFKAFNDLFVDTLSKVQDNSTIDILSMGMSDDYLIAIEEGSTMVRVGSAIFGERQYVKGD